MKFKCLLLCLLIFNFIEAQTYEIKYDEFYNNILVKNSSEIVLFAQNDFSLLTSQNQQKIYPEISTYYNYKEDFTVKKAILNNNKTIYTQIKTIDNGFTFELTDSIKKINGYTCKLALTSRNSNQIKIWYTNELKVKGSPKSIGSSLGLVLQLSINDNAITTVSSIKKLKKNIDLSLPKSTIYINAIDFEDELWKSKFTRIEVFKNDTINFTQLKNDHNEIKKFANGTVITKKIKIPELTANDQVFVDLVSYSQGDAYDRTGSVFVIFPNSKKQTFQSALYEGIATIPLYENNKKNEYRGFVATETYEPVLEIMRFFTPFGVQKFNTLKLKGRDWQNEVMYRQDISELNAALSNNEIILGTYIGNYDTNGHNVSLNISIHKGNTNLPKFDKVIPLFNTVNILEMAGQNYADLFENNNELKITFTLDETIENGILRYITTGHGGWAAGDEFLQKKNTVFLNGKVIYEFIPWRVDCGSYRNYNPASGNFENGLSSSDLSRANWCPGTITYPIYIPIGNLSKGTHTLSVKIPQGPKQGNSFSFWNVSGVLLGN